MSKHFDHLYPLIVSARKKEESFSYDEFIKYIEKNLDEIVVELNTKWLKSICDTIVDYDKTDRAAKAMIVSTYVNMLKFSSFDYKNIPDKSNLRKVWPEILWDGLLSIDRRADDFFHNMVNRILYIIGKDKIIRKIFFSLLARSIRKTKGPVGHMFKDHIYIEKYKELKFDLPDIHIR